MAITAAPPATRTLPTPAAVPLRESLPWAVLTLTLALVLLYLVGGEQGAVSLIGGHWVHEFAHDCRHMLGFPCH